MLAIWWLMGENDIYVVLLLGGPMTVGVTPSQADLLKGTAAFCAGRVGEESIWAVLHRDGHRLYGDELFADLFADSGRRSVPPSIVATVMVLQRLHGLSDREAVEAFTFDARWKYACGGLDFDYPGFAHTVLVDMRARLARSGRPDRIRDVTIDAAREAGLVGVRRVLDSTPLYDAVATMDTVTLIRSAIRSLLKVAGGLEAELRSALASGDDYASSAKPQIDWDDTTAREALIDSRAGDAYGCLAVLDGRDVAPEVTEAARLLATVVGQDLEDGDDGVVRIARKVAPDRVISTVDPDARHGHKTVHRGFDGYKGHVSVDPDSEIIVAATVTAGNVGDAGAASELLEELISAIGPRRQRPLAPAEPEAVVYGDAAYGTGPLLDKLACAGVDANIKVQPSKAPGGRFTKDDFDVDLETDTVTCPNHVTVAITWTKRSGGMARFADACARCPLTGQCTSSPKGRNIHLGDHEAQLARARSLRHDPARAADYRATRPKVERKLGHLMRRRHGGRRARVRGRQKVAADFNLLVAATNLARLAVLGLRQSPAGTWATLT
jgi:Transposase DDE domain/Transposase domain (DUF772)